MLFYGSQLPAKIFAPCGEDVGYIWRNAVRYSRFHLRYASLRDTLGLRFYSILSFSGVNFLGAKYRSSQPLYKERSRNPNCECSQRIGQLPSCCRNCRQPGANTDPQDNTNQICTKRDLAWQAPRPSPTSSYC